MIPAARVLHTGGVRAAYACYEEILNRPDCFFDADELIPPGLPIAVFQEIRPGNGRAGTKSSRFPRTPGNNDPAGKTFHAKG